MLTSYIQTILTRLWNEDEGLLTFEYVMLGTVLVVGSVGAVSNIRDSINSQATGLSNCIRSLDQLRPDIATVAGHNGNAASATSAAATSTSNESVPVLGPGIYGTPTSTTTTSPTAPSVSATALNTTATSGTEL